MGVYALMVQGTGANQTSSYALVKALADGTARVDETRYEVGDAGNPDVAWFEGHYYAAKAPGLAFVTLPAYLVLRSLGMRTSGDPTNMLWALGLVGTVLPIAVLLFLLRRVAEQIEPGFGTVTAATIGLGTLLLPFGTMFFVHALSAALAFAAFAVLWRERRSGRSLVGLALAGALAAFAITAEYPTGLIAVALGAYACSRRPFAARGAAYAAGLVAGLIPLLAFNWWAFGSPFHLSYVGTVEVAGVSGHDKLFEYEGLFGVSLPSLEAALVVLFTNWGLVTTAPVLVAAVVGIGLLYRHGLRAEALLVGFLAVAFTAYVSAFLHPWGDVAPGPRYLIPILPFLGVPLAAAYGRIPWTTLGLAAVSAGIMISVTITRPMAAWDNRILERLFSRDLEGYSPTAPDVFGITGWYDVLPVFLAVGLVIVLTLSATDLDRPSARSLAWAALVALFAVACTRVAPGRGEFNVLPQAPQAEALASETSWLRAADARRTT